MKKIIALLVTLSVAAPAFADTTPQTLKQSLARASLVALEQARPNAKSADDNPYYWPSIIVMSAGGLITLYGLTHDSGVECNTTVSNFSCGATKSKAVIFTGLGVVGVGGFLFGKSKSHPDVTFGPHVVGVRQQFSW